MPGVIRGVRGKNLDIEDEDGQVHQIASAQCKVMGKTSEEGLRIQRTSNQRRKSDLFAFLQLLGLCSCCLYSPRSA